MEKSCQPPGGPTPKRLEWSHHGDTIGDELAASPQKLAVHIDRINPLGTRNEKVVIGGYKRAEVA